MGRSRYKIYEPTHPHFVTCTILNWLPAFTRKESVEILIQSFKHLQKEDNFHLAPKLRGRERTHGSGDFSPTTILFTRKNCFFRGFSDLCVKN